MNYNKAFLILSLALFSVATYARSDWVDGLGMYAKSIKRSRFAWSKLAKKSALLAPVVAPAKPTTNSSLLPPPASHPRVITADPSLGVRGSDGSWRQATPEEVANDLAALRARMQEAARGVDLMLKGKECQGRSVMYRLMQEDPADRIVPSELAKACVKLGKYEKALALFAPMIRADASSDVLLRVAFAGAMSGHVFDGQKAYTDRIPLQAAVALRCSNAIPSNSNLAGARESAALAMGIMYMNGGYDKDAVPYLKIAERLNPRNPFTLYSLGQIYHRQKDYDAAADVFGRAEKEATGLLKGWAKREYEGATYTSDCIARDKAKRTVVHN